MIYVNMINAPSNRDTRHCLPNWQNRNPGLIEERSSPPSFPYHRPLTYPLCFVREVRRRRGRARFGNWQNATVVRALINGAPVAAPVTMQFALRARAVHTRRTRGPAMFAARDSTVSPSPFQPSSLACARVLSQQSDKAVTRVTRWHGTRDN